MFVIEIEDETINKALQAHVDSLCKAESHYNNPIKKIVNDLLDSYAEGPIKD